MSRTPASTTTRVRHRGGRRRRLHFLRPRRRRHRRREQELDQDHRRGDAGLRAGLLRLRLEEVRLAHDHRTCASGRSRSGRPISFSGPVHRLPSVPVRRARRHARRGDRRRGVPAQQPLRSGRGLGRAAANDAGGDHPQTHPLYVIDADRVAIDAGHGRPDQHDHADLLLRDLRRAAARRGDRKIKDAIEATYGRKGKELVERTSRPSIARSTTCTKSTCRRGDQHARAARRSCPRTRPSSSSRSRP